MERETKCSTCKHPNNCGIVRNRICEGYGYGLFEPAPNGCINTECRVGIYHNHENTHLITLSEYDKLFSPLNINPNIKYNIDKFNYCPYCGKSIIWNEESPVGEELEVSSHTDYSDESIIKEDERWEP